MTISASLCVGDDLDCAPYTDATPPRARIAVERHARPTLPVLIRRSRRLHYAVSLASVQNARHSLSGALYASYPGLRVQLVHECRQSLDPEQVL